MGKKICTKDPYLDDYLQNWIVFKANKELWRMQTWYTLADLIQDGYMCYAKCARRYQPKMPKKPSQGDKKWFMALVQTTFHNHIMTLSATAARTKEDCISQIAPESDSM